MVKNENWSNELSRLLEFMEASVAKDYPSPTLGVEYFVLALLEQKSSFAYSEIDGLLSSSALGIIEDSYRRYLESKALNIVKPGREIKYSTDFMETLKLAEEESKKLDSEKVTSNHVLLAILNSPSKENKTKKVFNKAGLTYSMLLDKVSSPVSDDDWDMEADNTPKNVKIIKNGTGVDVVVDIDKGQDPTEVIKNIIGMRDGVAPQKKKKTSGDYPNIEAYCTNLNRLVLDGKIDRLIGREREINEIIRVLGRRKKHNCILVGSEGVGKTAIGENLAYKIMDGNVPEFLANKAVVSLDMTALMAGTTLRGMFEERVKGVLDEIKRNGNFILFIDNIGDVLASGKKDEYDISAMLSHSLENGDVQVIGTADFASYRKVFDKDASLGRRFQKIIVEAPSLEDSDKILEGLKAYYEDYHCVKYTDEAIKACVSLANRYITERNLPDSAIDILDEAGSLVGTSTASNDKIKALREEYAKAGDGIEAAKKADNYDEVDKLEKEQRDLVSQIMGAKKAYAKERKENPAVIDENVILNIVSMKTGIPVNKLTSDDKKKLATINERLKAEIIGQDETIDIICKSLKRNRVGLSSGKCMFSALAIGPTGVGKTLTAKKLAKEIFGDEKALIRFDMSEYPDKTAVNKLIGSNPGYVGYEEGGQLTEAIKNRKHCVLLLDEIEKADPEVYNIFLQVLDEGFLTDNSGMKVDFKNVIIIFTSNVGAKNASDFGRGIGFNEDINANTKRILGKELKNKFPPEFLNRLNSVIYFNKLTDENLKEIIKIEIEKLRERLTGLGYRMTYDDAVLEKILMIIKEEKEFGARPVIRAIQDNIEDKITDLLLENDYPNGYLFEISCLDGGKEITVA